MVTYIVCIQYTYIIIYTYNGLLEYDAIAHVWCITRLFVPRILSTAMRVTL